MMTSIVLAGGQSQRLGQDKASLVIGGDNLLKRVISRLSPLSDEVVVAVSQQQAPLPLPLDTKARRVVDVYPGKGSLGGIYSGLAAARWFHSLVVACDMPFLNVNLLRYLIGLSPDFDVVVPRLTGKVEPLHAVYSKNCLGPIQRLLELGGLKIVQFFDSVRVRYVDEVEIDRFDPEHLSFFNINNQADLEQARALLSQEAMRS